MIVIVVMESCDYESCRCTCDLINLVDLVVFDCGKTHVIQCRCASL